MLLPHKNNEEKKVTGDQKQDLKECHEAVSGRFRLDIRKSFFIQRVFEH